jgi:hypothetical protein
MVRLVPQGNTAGSKGNIINPINTTTKTDTKKACGQTAMDNGMMMRSDATTNAVRTAGHARQATIKKTNTTHTASIAVKAPKTKKKTKTKQHVKQNHMTNNNNNSNNKHNVLTTKAVPTAQKKNKPTQTTDTIPITPNSTTMTKAIASTDAVRTAGHATATRRKNKNNTTVSFTTHDQWHFFFEDNSVITRVQERHPQVVTGAQAVAQKSEQEEESTAKDQVIAITSTDGHCTCCPRHLRI